MQEVKDVVEPKFARANPNPKPRSRRIKGRKPNPEPPYHRFARTIQTQSPQTTDLRERTQTHNPQTTDLRERTQTHSPDAAFYTHEPKPAQPNPPPQAVFRFSLASDIVLLSQRTSERKVSP